MLALLGETVCPYCGVGCRLRVEGDDRGITRSPRGGVGAGQPRPAVREGGPARAHRSHAGPGEIPARAPLPHRALRPGALGRRASASSPASSARSSPSTAPTPSPSTAAASSTPRRPTWPCKLFKGSPRHEQHRLEQPAVHGGGGGRLSQPASAATARRRCYEDIDLADVILDHRQQHGRGPPGHVRPRQGAARRRGPSSRSSSSIRGGRRRRKIADLHVPVAPGGDIALLNAVGRLLIDAGRDRRRLHRATTRTASRSTATSCWSSRLDELCVAAAASPEAAVDAAGRG